jgi:predicted SAM-dependent methyltransferase
MIKINMGCGWRNFGSDWIHIDGGDYDHLDYCSIETLDFRDNSVDLIYASHVIEYFDRQSVRGLLREWHRVLKPSDTLRLAVPNFKVLTELYSAGEISIDQALGPLYGRMEMDGTIIYHKTVYDWRKTSHAHFDDHSQAYIPHMDKENGTLISLNVECVK